MARHVTVIILVFLLFAPLAFADKGEKEDEDKGGKGDDSSTSCVQCHRSVTPNIVTDWELSKHKETAGCKTCHGAAHTSEGDVDEAEVPTPDVCAECHQERV